ncbi:AraC family transcriptional regulator [Paenibacillus selenitireducens]|uniref:AraC family transcriptional regulator n=1 Tax=Paenibacillus selenitireducens TaxID=1324314 RepID=A0A1T2X2V1_9BACL|nr:helix-turn-helix domain-containing protein [Paenibacillus selenitireducens]OPA74228.1 AraC family transcriptional regulator [Paenibacillus selenitireducens]
MFKPTYLRIFAWSGIFIILVIIPFSYFLIQRFAGYATSQIGLINHDRIEETLDRTEFILAKLKWYSLNMYEDQTIKNWMYSEKDDPLLDAAALQTLSKYLSKESFFEGAYLFNMRREKVIDFDVGLLPFEEFKDKIMLERVKRQDPALLRYSYHETGSKSYLTLLLPPSYVKKEQYGYLVVLLNKHVMQQYLISGGGGTDHQVTLMDQSGQVILGKMDEEMMKNVMHSRTAASQGAFEMKVDGEQTYVNYADLDSQDWTLYSLSGMEQFRKQATAFQQAILLSSILLLFLLLLAAFWNSHLSFKPFRRLANQLHGKLRIRAASDYDAIQQSVLLLRDHYTLIKTEYLRQWILQGRLSEQARQALARESKILEHTWIRLAVVKIDAYYEISEQYDFASRRLLKYAVGNIAEEMLSCKDRSIEVVDFGGDHLLLLIGVADQADDVLEELQEMRRQVMQYVRINIIVACSTTRHVRDDLRLIYDDLCEWTLFKFVSGDDKIYTEQEYERYADLQVQPDDTLLDLLIQSIRSGKEEQSLDLLAQLFARLQTMKFAECQFQLRLLFFSFVKAFSKRTTLNSMEGIENSLKKFTKLEDIHRWMKDEIVRMISLLGDQKRINRKVKNVEEVIEYIQCHIHDPRLSVDDIADHIALSAKYVRQLFLDQYGMSLSNYILNMRIEKVKELLQHSDTSVAEISQQAGFLTKSHFFTAFKKATGMTPAQYRYQQLGVDEASG